MRIAWLALLVALVVTAASPPAASAPLGAAETLVGTWKGQWTAYGLDGRGSVGLVLARVPGNSAIIGQFTFVTGGTTRSLRYEGRIEDGRLRFPLVGDGQIVLHPVAARPGVPEGLRGEWNDERGALPAGKGVIELSRTN